MLGPMTAAASPTRPPSGGTDGTYIPIDHDMTSIRVETEGSTVVISVERCLDNIVGEALLSAASAAVATGPTRLDIDLRSLEDFTDEGADALVSCRELGAKLAEGLHYRTGRGPGRDALLTAYRDLQIAPDDV